MIEGAHLSALTKDSSSRTENYKDIFYMVICEEEEEVFFGAMFLVFQYAESDSCLTGSF